MSNSLAMEITESLPTHPIQPLRMHWAYWQGVAFMLLVFLAYERWMAGGGDLTPEQGLRGWVEIILVTLAFLAALLAWGVKPFLNSFRLSTFVCLILFGTLATISALWSPNFILSLGKAGGLVLITLLASAIAYQAACLGLPVAKMILVALILVSVAEISRPPFTSRKHRAGAHLENAAAACTRMNDARDEHSGQQTTTAFYHS